MSFSPREHCWIGITMLSDGKSIYPECRAGQALINIIVRSWVCPYGPDEAWFKEHGVAGDDERSVN